MGFDVEKGGRLIRTPGRTSWLSAESGGDWNCDQGSLSGCGERGRRQEGAQEELAEGHLTEKRGLHCASPRNAMCPLLCLTGDQTLSMSPAPGRKSKNSSF